MASLFEAIVLQNLSVLTRGHTLRPHVLLLGGPNSFIRGMREAWQANIPRMWKERKVAIPEGAKPEDLIKVPENAQYFAALGAVEFGRSEDDCVGCYRGYETGSLHRIRTAGRESKVRRQGARSRIPRISSVSKKLSPQEIHARGLSERTARSRDLSESTADRPRRRPFCSTKTATFSASLISSRTAIRFKTRLRCSRICADRSKRRMRSWKCWAWRRRAMRRTF